MIKKTPELLAPAGGMKQLVAAVENGADAVYLGGSLFNARIHADNFTEEEIAAAISYSHLRNVKVYITLNILLDDQELLPALQYAARLYNMGADGLILQDLGLADLVRERLPKLPIHLSTQGSVYNLSGVKKAKKLGFSRVVLARELSLQEISQIAKAKICDLEVFVHGALCMCYSGQCQMSRILGGGDRSGNRGLCAQPCRLPYVDDTGKRTYALSPKDLCLVDHLGDLAAAGAASLKIEGRMKSPEYVAAVTSIYRKYLDLYMEQGFYTVSDTDRQILAQIFNRGGFTTGYLQGNPGKRLLSGKLPKHQGVYIGKVAAPVRGTNLVDIDLAEELEQGDGVEIRSSQLTGNVVTFLEPQKGGLVRIGDIKGQVKAGDPIYRITSSALMKELRQTYEEGGADGTKHRKKVPVAMSLEVKTGKSPLLTVTEGPLQVRVTDREAVAEEALHRPLSRDAAEKQLKKTGGTPFKAAELHIDLEEGCTLPLSVLNRLRRRGLQALEEKKLMPVEQAEIPVNLEQKPYHLESRIAFYFYNADKFYNWDFKGSLAALNAEQGRAYVPLQFFMENKPQMEHVEVVPYVLNISKGKLDHYIEANFKEIVARTKDCGIALGNLAWTEEFVSCGVQVFADYGLNLYNQQALWAADKQGLCPVCLSQEYWDAKEGAIPLMITENPLKTKTLKDRKNTNYKIVYNFENDKSMLFKEAEKWPIKKLQKSPQKSFGEHRIYIL